MKIGFYQHGSVSAEGVADAISALGVKVAFRNANYFNERETEKFDRVVVDEGKNTDAIRTAYGVAGVEVVGLDAFLKGKEPKAVKVSTPEDAPAPVAPVAPDAPVAPVAKAPLNVDGPRKPRKPGKKQGE
ncbi:hypothetical protein U8C35_06455 [Sinorhizobium medicae]|uniref:hypothetical protein n=1 Tax=Sinorhizobium medicae TaxID=110321 RepID=UPI002AF6AD2D|nr:hypothetical protein [Sinorhizobium medicae]WQO60074.1 hypothetical protein U8C35_06455 [Sinorhizobium medicae]